MAITLAHSYPHLPTPQRCSLGMSQAFTQQSCSHFGRRYADLPRTIHDGDVEKTS